MAEQEKKKLPSFSIRPLWKWDYKKVKIDLGLLALMTLSIVAVALSSPSNPNQTTEQVKNNNQIRVASSSLISPSKITNQSQNINQIKIKKPNIAGESKYTNLVKVLRVIDGDMIEAEDLGKVRLIGIDTPETVDPRKPVQCFGKEASGKAKEMLLGKKVHLESDPTQGDKDKYNRALRYVFLEDGTNFNKWMIENGYAHEYTYNIPYKYQREFKDAEKSARDNNRGLWASDTCAGNTNPVATQSSGSKLSNQQSNQSNGQCLIKGNISSSGEKIYHMPGGAYYNKTIIDKSRGERWFCTEADAQTAGWRRSMR